MKTKDLFRMQAHFIIFLFLVNFLANKFHWYYSIWWFDIFMHFIGGVWLGVVFVWLCAFRKLPLTLNFPFVLRLILSVLIVGVGWEVFEYYFINYMAQNNFDVVDTVSDLVLDISGGLLASTYLLYKHKKIIYN